MIDWQVRVDGEPLPDVEEHSASYWFPTFEYQEYLLSYFDVGGEFIDPYGLTTYAGEDLHRLRKVLVNRRYSFSVRPAQWRVADEAGFYYKEFVVEQAIVLALCDETIAMIDTALNRGGVLVFRGD